MIVEHKQAGYTLIEVIVALTLSSILAVALSGSLSFGSRVWEKTSRSARENGDLVSAYEFLNQSFGRLAKRPPGTSEQNASQQDQVPDFAGTNHDLTFRASGFAAVGLLGPHLVRLQRVDKRLQVSVLEADHPGVVLEDRDFVLLDSTESMDLAYRGFDDADSDTGWVDGWSRDRSFPCFVRITIGRSDDQTQSWVFRLPDSSQ
jgi:general secretion pathway protein J